MPTFTSMCILAGAQAIFAPVPPAYWPLLPAMAQASEPAPPPPADPAANSDVLDDATIPKSGEIEPDLSVMQRDPANWLGVPPEREWLNFIRDPLKRLDQEHGLAVTGAYTILFQQSAGPNAHSAGAGDFDLTAKWTLLGRGTPDTGAFYTAIEYRHDIGSITPNQLGGEIGTLLGTTNGFSDRRLAVKDAYWAQRLFDDHFRFGIGRADPENLVGLHKLQSANTSFLNKAFSTNPTIAFPGAGAAAAASLRPTQWFYLSGGVANAYGNFTTIEVDTLVDEWRFFKFGEAGFTPTIEGVGQGRYRVAIWHFDDRDLTGQPSDEGISLIADQDIGERGTVFARYGYADADLTKVRQSVQVGGAIGGLLGVEDDLTGLAVAWSEPLADLRDEKVLEVFHRFQITGRTQLTLGAQWIIDPSNAPDADSLGVFSARLRMSF
jgi:hypothetical protein